MCWLRNRRIKGVIYISVIQCTEIHDYDWHNWHVWLYIQVLHSITFVNLFICMRLHHHQLPKFVSALNLPVYTHTILDLPLLQDKLLLFRYGPSDPTNRLRLTYFVLFLSFRFSFFRNRIFLRSLFFVLLPYIPQAKPTQTIRFMPPPAVLKADSQPHRGNKMTCRWGI